MVEQQSGDADLISNILQNVNNAQPDRPKEQQPELDPNVIAEMKDVFSLFDFKNDGTIATEDLGTVLRGLGHNLTEEQIGDYINENDHDGSKLDFPTFYSIVAKNQEDMRGPSTVEEVEEYFEPFDMYKDGEIMVEDFVNMLRQMGEPLTPDDVHHLLREIHIDGDNKVNIRGFIRHMFETSTL
jgi:calmodulin